ncbi:MAG: hypothetical protein WC900_08610, partial [Oscillospiraceae bacterium]
YYVKLNLNLESPFVKNREVSFCELEMKNIPLAEMTYILRNAKLSKSCSDYIARKTLSLENSDVSEEGRKLLKEMNERLENEIKNGKLI